MLIRLIIDQVHDKLQQNLTLQTVLPCKRCFSPYRRALNLLDVCYSTLLNLGTALAHVDQKMTANRNAS